MTNSPAAPLSGRRTLRWRSTAPGARAARRPCRPGQPCGEFVV